MKNYLILGVITIFTFIASAQTKFTINYNQGFGRLPTFTKYDSANLYSLEEANRLFNYVKDSTGIEFRYSYAGCEKRAHAVSMLLSSKKIHHYKIWNFDPSMISLFNEEEKPCVESKTGLNDTVSWRYHVAILLFIREKNEINPVVIDPAIANDIISEKTWLDLQHAPSTYYTCLDPQWYNYATTDKFEYFCNNTAYAFPPCLTGLFTGDFFLNDGVSLSEMWVEEALAVNQVGMKIIDNIIKREPSNSEKGKVFIELVKNFDNLTNVLKGVNLPANIQLYSNMLKPYQKEFVTLRSYWKTKLDPLRN
jgi:hypothetical protein